jgi:hypothetical protein
MFVVDQTREDTDKKRITNQEEVIVYLITGDIRFCLVCDLAVDAISYIEVNR